MSLDLSLASNSDWEKIFEANDKPNLVLTGVETLNYYAPPPPKFVALDKHVLLIGISAVYSKPTWFLGGRASQYLYISPSSTPTIAQGVQACETKRLRLNAMTLVQFQNFGKTPYVLLIEIPRWFRDVHVEVWKYLGFEDNDPTGISSGGNDSGIY